MPKYRDGIWDGYISLLKGLKTFPTGMLFLITEAFRSEGWTVTIDSKGVRLLEEAPFYFPDSILNGVTLRDYQGDAVDALLYAERGIAKMATNAGKTVVFAALIKLLGNRNALVVVQSKDLLYQTSERLSEYLGRSVGLIGDSQRDEDDICVATIQTLSSLKKHKISIQKRFAENGILVCDEAHHASASQTFDILMRIPGWYRYGFSGTPLDRGLLNDLKLIACTGSLQVEVSNLELIEQEWSAKPLIFLHDVLPMEGMWTHSYQEAYGACVVMDTVRNKLIQDIAAEETQRGSVLILSLIHI